MPLAPGSQPTPPRIRHRQHHRCSSCLHYYALEDYRQGLALIAEDCGAVARPRWLQRGALRSAHFCPSRCNWPQGSRRCTAAGSCIGGSIPQYRHQPRHAVVKFIDFGMTSRLKQDAQQVTSRSRRALAYLAPEQTGRMHQAIDSRTDLYELGVTFYQMLTGAVPFPSHDPLEVLHGHWQSRRNRCKTSIPPYHTQCRPWSRKCSEVLGRARPECRWPERMWQPAWSSGRRLALIRRFCARARRCPAQCNSPRSSMAGNGKWTPCCRPLRAWRGRPR